MRVTLTTSPSPPPFLQSRDPNPIITTTTTTASMTDPLLLQITATLTSTTPCKEKDPIAAHKIRSSLPIFITLLIIGGVIFTIASYIPGSHRRRVRKRRGGVGGSGKDDYTYTHTHKHQHQHEDEEEDDTGNEDGNSGDVATAAAPRTCAPTKSKCKVMKSILRWREEGVGMGRRGVNGSEPARAQRPHFVQREEEREGEDEVVQRGIVKRVSWPDGERGGASKEARMDKAFVEVFIISAVHAEIGPWEGEGGWRLSCLGDIGGERLVDLDLDLDLEEGERF